MRTGRPNGVTALPTMSCAGGVEQSPHLFPAGGLERVPAYGFLGKPQYPPGEDGEDKVIDPRRPGRSTRVIYLSGTKAPSRALAGVCGRQGGVAPERSGPWTCQSPPTPLAGECLKWQGTSADMEHRVRAMDDHACTVASGLY
jgi:hypothetical protein